ncbi:MAG: 1-acyl-sn-glycerol-3-phosphate acyltransferase [Syntrophobacteraceae bacterium]|nr:1-acyl-sn-glycerol-3-phosphate acyltransferase [Syntrophobacteraceae bacterium]
MFQWWQKMRGEKPLSIQQDPFGYAVDHKPSFLFQSWLEKLISKTFMPEDQQRLLDDLSRKGTIVYAIKYRSQLDFVFISLRLYQLGLPSPEFIFDLHPYAWQRRWYALKIFAYHLYHYCRYGRLPNPYDGGYYREKVEKGASGVFFLVGKRGYYQRTVLVGNDPLEHLVEIQKQTARPVFVVPLVLLYSRDPGRQRRGLLEIFLGQRENQGVFRKLVSFFRSYPNAVLEAGEPLNLQEVLPELSENLGERRKQIFQLRRNLIDSTDTIKRAIVGPLLKSKIELKEIILHHPRLETFMQRRARSSKQEIWKVRMEADQYLEEIAAGFNFTLFQLGEKVLSWMWNNLFDGIHVDMESLHKVKKAARNNTLVYIPTHKSHMDYLILSHVLFHNNLSLPIVAAGKNLAFWPIGPLFRRGGAFFIRRSFKGLKFYTEVFSIYVKTMVQHGHNIEFFIEGGRSRTGKMVLPKLGLLAILIQAVEEGFCQDLVFVPTSISYDHIPEQEAYLNEITGGTKVEENLGQLVRARRFLKRRYGRVYVQFAEPISLQRYLARYRGNREELKPRERHAMYRDFAYRIINSINQASLVTPHALAASAFMTTARHGVSTAEFQEVCRTFYDYLNQQEVRFSNTFRSYDVTIDETLHDLERSKLIGKLKDEDDDLEEEVFTMEDNKRLALEYYKNNVIHFLLPAACVSTSILAQQTFRFSVAQVLEDVAFMKNFFKYEFVYDNEVSNEDLVRKVLDTFEKMGLLHRVEPNDRPFLLSHKGLKAAYAFHGLLRNYFEGYWIVFRSLRYLHKKPYSEKDFMKKILNLGQKALKLELIERPESISKILFANAIQYFLENGIIEKKMDPKGKDRDQEWYAVAGNRPLVQEYSRQISRFLRSPYFTLQ